MINKFTKGFIKDFCNKDGEIDWEKLVRFNSSSIPKKKSNPNFAIKI